MFLVQVIISRLGLSCSRQAVFPCPAGTGLPLGHVSLARVKRILCSGRSLLADNHPICPFAWDV